MKWYKYRKWNWMLVIIICGWITFTQSCMKFRISDSKAITAFAKDGVLLKIADFKFENFNLHYATTGLDTLPTLLFIHGSPGSWDGFTEYMKDKDLLKKFRIVSIDRPGFGHSNFGKAFHLKQQAYLIENLLQKITNQKPIHLIGHSIAGPILIKLAQNSPNAYASLTILAGSISPKDEPKEYWRYVFFYPPFKWLLPGAFKPSNTEIVYFKKDLFSIGSNYYLLKMPINLFHGDKDKFVTVKNTIYAKEKLKHNENLQIVIIPNGGHFIPWTHFGLIKSHLLNLTN